MLLLIVEIVMFGVGVVALFTGKIKIGSEPVYGIGARLAGAILASLLPSMFFLRAAIGFAHALDLIVVIVFGTLAAIVAKTMGTPESQRFGRNYDDYEEPRSRRRAAALDEYDDEEPRPRGRRPSEDRVDRTDGFADEEPRPRRRRRPADDDV